jgi:hypothetical protein
MTFLTGVDGAYLTHFPPTASAEEIATKVVVVVGSDT